MSTEYVNNGDFKNDLKNWRLDPDGSQPDFAPYKKGQSILLPPSAVVTQYIPDLPDEPVTVSFDVCWEEESEIPVYVVSFGGVASDGYARSWLHVDLASKNWETISTTKYPGTKLTSCFFIVSAAIPNAQRRPKFGPIRIAELSLTTG